MNKKKIKIDFRYFWDGFEKENNFFIDLLKKDYNVVIDEKNPEFVIFSVFETPELRKSESFYKRIIYRGLLSLRFKSKKKLYNLLRLPAPQPYRIPKLKGDFVKIFYTGENILPDMKKCDWAFSFYYDSSVKNPKHMRLPLYYFDGYENRVFKKISSAKKTLKEKSRFCNFIYSNDVYFRNKFFKMLNEYKRVDSGGKCLNNMNGSPLDINNNSRSPFETKIEFLKQYKFTIAFENSITSGYTTEKLVHPMIANSIPIYYGNPDVAKDFNPKSFINVSDFNSFEEVIKKIIEIDNNDSLYLDMLKEPWLKNNKKNKYMDEEKLRKRLRLIFG